MGDFFQNLIPYLIGAGMSDQRPSGYFQVVADMTSATWNTQATHEIATLTGGACRLRILIECQDTLTDAADGASMQFGYEGATDAYIPTTGAAGAGGSTITAGQMWYGAGAPLAGVHNNSQNMNDNFIDVIVSGGLDIGYEITGAALTGGRLKFSVWWESLSQGNVVPGAGGTL